MDEAQLISLYDKTIDEIIEKKVLLKSLNPDHYIDKFNELNSSLETLEKSKIEISTLIKSNPDISLTIKKKDAVISVLYRLLERLSSKKDLQNFLRDQNTCRYGEILIRVVDDIGCALHHHVKYRISEYSQGIEGDFNTDELVSLLYEGIRYLEANEINNYIELFDYVDSFQSSIISLDKDCGRIL
jgi:hypothetical protein